MNIIDSSGWLAYFADEKNASHFLEPLKQTSQLIVPVITIYEVFKVILRGSNENNALIAIAAMRKGTVIDLNTSLAMAAADISLKHKIPMADSIIYATALNYNATVWTQDIDFAHLPNVRYFQQ